MITRNTKGILQAAAIYLLLMACTCAAKAQAKTDAAALTSKLSPDLSIGQQTASALKAALNGPTLSAKYIQSDTLLSTKEKQQQMAELSARRHHAIDSLLTPEQKRAFIQQAAAARAASYRIAQSDTTKVNH